MNMFDLLGSNQMHGFASVAKLSMELILQIIKMEVNFQPFKFQQVSISIKSFLFIQFVNSCFAFFKEVKLVCEKERILSLFLFLNSSTIIC